MQLLFGVGVVVVVLGFVAVASLALQSGLSSPDGAVHLVVDSSPQEPLRLAAQSEITRLVNRVREIRTSGMQTDGLASSRQKVRISKNDYLLMGADNSCAARNHPSVPENKRIVFKWFSGAEDLGDMQFYNCHSTKNRRTGKWVVDSFLTDLPRPEYQSSAEEVVWHYQRVLQLRAAGMPTNERIATLAAEAKGRPWELQEQSQ